MEVLVYLAGRADKLVSKQDLIDHVWQAEVVTMPKSPGLREARIAGDRVTGLVEESKGMAQAEGIDTLPLLEAKALLWDMTGGTVE